MRKTCLIMTSACGLFAANEPATFSGVITDTLCGRSHGMMKAPSDDASVRSCLKGSGQFAQRIKVSTAEAAGENK